MARSTIGPAASSLAEPPASGAPRSPDPIEATDGGTGAIGAVDDPGLASPTVGDATGLTIIDTASPTVGNAVTAVHPPVSITNIFTTALGSIVPPMPAFPFGLNSQCSRPTSTQRTARMVARREAEESARSRG